MKMDTEKYKAAIKENKWWYKLMSDLALKYNNQHFGSSFEQRKGFFIFFIVFTFCEYLKQYHERW